MSDDVKRAWSEVAESFAALGRVVQERYRSGAGVARDQPAEAAPGEPAEQHGAAELRDAFDRLLAAGREVGDRASGAVRDDDVRTQASKAAHALNDALAATVDLIGDEVSTLFGSSRRDEPPRPPGDPSQN